MCSSNALHLVSVRLSVTWMIGHACYRFFLFLVWAAGEGGRQTPMNGIAEPSQDAEHLRESQKDFQNW